jgi:hypothetical protein
MSNTNKRARVFKAYKQPSNKAARVDDSDKDGKAAPTLSNIRDDLIEADPLVAPAPIFAPISTESRPGNLRVSNESYQIITGHLNKLEPLVKRRNRIIKIHEALVSSVNSGSIPAIARVNPHPSPPPGIEFQPPFALKYKETAKAYSIQLAALIVAEYKSLIEEITSEINFETHEAQTQLQIIIDEEDRKKSLELFQVKLKALTRRTENNRTDIKATRRIRHR